jgi:hypothetical protein
LVILSSSSDVSTSKNKSSLIKPSFFIKVDRKRLAIKEVYGFAEEHFAKW